VSQVCVTHTDKLHTHVHVRTTLQRYSTTLNETHRPTRASSATSSPASALRARPGARAQARPGAWNDAHRGVPPCNAADARMHARRNRTQAITRRHACAPRRKAHSGMVYGSAHTLSKHTHTVRADAVFAHTISRHTSRVRASIERCEVASFLSRHAPLPPRVLHRI